MNENYGRELMELHTLGVDGGYTQKDVTEVARCFTGWTINQPQRGGKFVFNPRLHDNGEKVVLGVTIPAGGGEKDGEKVLDILARQPATARFISKKLAMRFVADDPPAALLDHMSDTFLKTDGDIRQVMLDHDRFERILVGGRVPQQNEVAARNGGQRRALGERQCGFRHGADATGGAVGRAALPQAGTDRLFQLQQGMGEFRQPDGAHEFCSATGRQ